MCPRIVTKSFKELNEQLTFTRRQYQEHLDSFNRLQQEFGSSGSKAVCSELTEKIRMYSALSESLKELIHLKSIRIWI